MQVYIYIYTRRNVDLCNRCTRVKQLTLSLLQIQRLSNAYLHKLQSQGCIEWYIIKVQKNRMASQQCVTTCIVRSATSTYLSYYIIFVRLASIEWAASTAKKTTRSPAYRKRCLVALLTTKEIGGAIRSNNRSIIGRAGTYIQAYSDLAWKERVPSYSRQPWLSTLAF